MKEKIRRKQVFLFDKDWFSGPSDLYFFNFSVTDTYLWLMSNGGELQQITRL